jgi:DNA-binding GntR family transcriptional regulator
MVTGQRLDFFDALARPLREQIDAGVLRPGALLPSESELARATGTKRYSVRKALALLRDEGLIEAIPGCGWAVLNPTSALGDTGLRPRYRQIAGELRTSIEAGRPPGGARLASEAELMARFKVARATVRQALALLESDGLVITYPGNGRYVADR